MLEWMGETGCKYTGVIHANSAGSGGYSVQGGTTLDAMRMMQGTCTFTLAGQSDDAGSGEAVSDGDGSDGSHGNGTVVDTVAASAPVR